MNDEARELLVAAALRDHRQIVHYAHDRNSDHGECAIGVLHLEFHSTRAAAVRCWRTARLSQHDWEQRFGIDGDASFRIGVLNDSGADFLTIARKVGAEEPRDP